MQIAKSHRCHINLTLHESEYSFRVFFFRSYISKLYFHNLWWSDIAKWSPRRIAETIPTSIKIKITISFILFLHQIKISIGKKCGPKIRRLNRFIGFVQFVRTNHDWPLILIFIFFFGKKMDKEMRLRWGDKRCHSSDFMS